MITALDKNTALVLIDLQKGVVKMDLAHPISGVLEKSALLLEAFRNANLPVVVVKVVPGGTWIKSRKDGTTIQSAPLAPDFADIADEIKTLPTDIFIIKQTWNAFYGTSLHEELQKRQVTGIVLAGVSTSIGVEGTSRSASELGYNVAFATDAMTDRIPAAHQHSTEIIFPRLGERGTSAEIIEKLKDRT